MSSQIRSSTKTYIIYMTDLFRFMSITILWLAHDNDDALEVYNVHSPQASQGGINSNCSSAKLVFEINSSLKNHYKGTYLI